MRTSHRAGGRTRCDARKSPRLVGVRGRPAQRIRPRRHQGRPDTDAVRRQALSAVRCATLVTASRHDRGVDFATAQSFAAAIPGAVLVELDAPSHLLWLGPGQERLRSVVRDFLAGAAVTGTPRPLRRLPVKPMRGIRYRTTLPAQSEGEAASDEHRQSGAGDCAGGPVGVRVLIGVHRGGHLLRLGE